MNDFCNYFQAHIPPSDCFLVIGFLKSYDHICFIRTIDPQQGLLEFFVPPHTTEEFTTLIQYLEKNALIFNFKKEKNRLI